MSGTIFNFEVRPRMDGPDPDEVMRRDMVDALGSLRRRLRLMVVETEQRQKDPAAWRRARALQDAEHRAEARRRPGRKSITTTSGGDSLPEPTAHEREMLDRYGLSAIQLLAAEKRGRR